MRRGVLALALVVLLALPGGLLAQTISTPGGASIQSFGKPNTQTYGQRFTAANTSLDAFSFWLSGGATGLNFRAYVYAWDDTFLRATGPALFTSGILSGPAGAGFQEVAIGTGGVLLDPGQLYVAFLSTSGIAGTGAVAWEASQGDFYADGGLVFTNNGEDTGQWTAQTWGGVINTDMRFSMDFSQGGPNNVVPEPISMVLLGSGLAGVGALRRRRRSDLLEDDAA